MSTQAKITIDGQTVEVEAGRNLVQAAHDHGFFIPSLCYYDHIDPPLGTCRVCTCKIDGQIRQACTEQTYDGMKIEIDTPELIDIRKAIVEMMFSEGNHFCPACQKSGNCDLQHLGYEMGMDHIRFPHLFQDELIDFAPQRMIMEHNRCIKCARCVVEVLTDDDKQVFSFCNRGNETVVGIDYEQEAKLSDQQAIEAMQLCPTGAIIIRDQGYAEPFGNRKFDLTSSKPHPKPAATSQSQPAYQIREKKVVATISLAGCFGCHMSLLDYDLKMFDVIDLIEFNKSPLNDIKEFTKQCDLGLIEGGCCNSENIEVLKEFRRSCDLLVCVGECAIWGGLPAMRNTIPLSECLEEAYLNGITSEPEDATVPYSEDLPKILDKVYACNEVVDIDHYIPGCPPNAEHIWKTVCNLLWGDHFSILYSDFKYD